MLGVRATGRRGTVKAVRTHTKRKLLPLLVLLGILVGLLLPVLLTAEPGFDSRVGQEVIALRGETSKTYYLGNDRGDDKFQFVTGGGIQHWKYDYEDNSEQWKEVNLTWEKLPGGKQQITQAPYIVVQDGAKITFTDRKTGETTTLERLSVSPTGLEYAIVPHSTGVSFQHILKNPNQPFEAQFRIKGNARVISKAFDDGGELELEASLKDGVLTERFSGVKCADTGQVRAAEGMVRIDPTLEIQPSDKDNALGQQYPTTNLGSSVTLYVSEYTNCAWRPIIYFLIAALPTSANVTSGTLGLYYFDQYDTNSMTVGSHRCTKTDWHETQSTWNIYKTGSSWTTAGGDYEASATNSIVLTNADYGWKSWDVKSIVEWAQSNGNHVSILMKSQSGGSVGYKKFYSNNNSGLHPKLVITYTIPSPSVTTNACTNAGAASVDGNAEVTDTGAGNITERGFCYITGTSGTPTVSDSKKYETGSWGTGVYSLTIDGLSPGTSYRVRAYAYNEDGGLGYGATVQTATLAYPVVTTHDATAVAGTQATLQGEITNIGGSAVTLRGFEWGTSTGVYTANWTQSGSYGTGTFSRTITGLTKGQVYYYRAFAENDQGMGYGSEKSFLTLPDPPTGLNATYAGGGTITLNWTAGDGADTTYIRGKEGSYPTSRSDGYLVYSGAAETCSDTGLVAGPTYYYRAWSYASGGGLTAYSSTYDEDYAAIPTGLVLWFQPTAMIEGTTLVDRTGGNDGTITWGTNPAGTSAELDSIESESQPQHSPTTDDPYRSVTPDVEVSDWFQEPGITTRLANHPFRPLVQIMSDPTTMTEVQAWRLWGLAIVLFMTVAAAVMVRSHLLIACILCAGTIGLMVQQTIFPAWALVFTIPALIAGIIAERTPSV